MQSNLTIPLDTVLTFLFVSVRISGAFLFVPFPGAARAIPQAKVLICILTALAVLLRRSRSKEPAWMLPR